MNHFNINLCWEFYTVIWRYKPSTQGRETTRSFLKREFNAETNIFNFSFNNCYVLVWLIIAYTSELSNGIFNSMYTFFIKKQLENVFFKMQNYF